MSLIALMIALVCSRKTMGIITNYEAGCDEWSNHNDDNDDDMEHGNDNEYDDTYHPMVINHEDKHLE